jgi:hypothetical protein
LHFESYLPNFRFELQCRFVVCVCKALVFFHSTEKEYRNLLYHPKRGVIFNCLFILYSVGDRKKWIYSDICGDIQSCSIPDRLLYPCPRRVRSCYLGNVKNRLWSTLSAENDTEGGFYDSATSGVVLKNLQQDITGKYPKIKIISCSRFSV